MQNKDRIAKRLRRIETFVKVQLLISIALLVGLCAFATNIYNATTLGEAIQAIEAQR